MSFSFDLEDYEVSSGGAIPAGTYRAEVDEVELKETRDGEGLYISARFSITDEKQNGRKFWEIYNIKNKSEKAVQIGLGNIKQLILAAGGNAGKFDDEQALLGLEAMVKLKVVTDDYGEKNKIVGYQSTPSELPAGAHDSTPFD